MFFIITNLKIVFDFSFWLFGSINPQIIDFSSVCFKVITNFNSVMARECILDDLTLLNVLSHFMK